MAVITYPAIVRNGKVEPVTPLDLPDGSEVYVVVPATITERVTRRKANGWLVSDVGNLAMADKGTLVQTEQGWVWHFEVYITSVNHAPWGPIGTVDALTSTGVIVEPEQTKAVLYQNGRSYQRPA
jgi:hypothetical protein